MGVVTSKKFKKWWNVKRFTEGQDLHGEWVEGSVEIIKIFANIQPAFSFYQTSLLPQGDRDKEAIWGSSEHWVYTAQSGGNLSPDIILYKGCEWEVKATMPYGNFGNHCEFVAIKIKDSLSPRKGGKVSVV